MDENASSILKVFEIIEKSYPMGEKFTKPVDGVAYDGYLEAPVEPLNGSDSAEQDVVLDTLLSTPWRDIGSATMDSEFCKKMINAVDKISCSSPAEQLNIAFFGHKCAGKSSFINTIKSHYVRYVAKVARTGEAVLSITTKYSKYNVTGDQDRQIWLCDTRGIDRDFSLNSADFAFLLNGQIKDDYQFDERKPIKRGNEKFISKPTINDRIHCVCFVFDGNTINNATRATYETIKTFLDKLEENHNLSFVILLTKIDKVCGHVAKDISNMYRSRKVEDLVNHVAYRLSIDPSDVVPVVNYILETETNIYKDAIALLALRQMLRRCNDFISNVTSKLENVQISKKGSTKKK